MTAQACGKCRYWKPVGDMTSNSRCRRYPPVAERSYGPTWPITMRNDWCGEFAPIDTAQTKIDPNEFAPSDLPRMPTNVAPPLWQTNRSWSEKFGRPKIPPTRPPAEKALKERQ